LNRVLYTSVLIWALTDSPRLGVGALALILSGASVVYVSAASCWEIAIKVALGRLEIGGQPDRILPAAFEVSNYQVLAISMEHALRAGALPRHHRDPFDRMLIAQAQMEGLQIVTADRSFSEYKVPTIDPTQ